MFLSKPGSAMSGEVNTRFITGDPEERWPASAPRRSCGSDGRGWRRSRPRGDRRGDGRKSKQVPIVKTFATEDAETKAGMDERHEMLCRSRLARWRWVFPRLAVSHSLSHLVYRRPVSRKATSAGDGGMVPRIPGEETVVFRGRQSRDRPLTAGDLISRLVSDY